MHRRILFGVAAWLLGAATATAGSLLAVSLLGQGITGGTGPLLTPGRGEPGAGQRVGGADRDAHWFRDGRHCGGIGRQTRVASSGSASPSAAASPSGTGPSDTAPSSTAPATPAASTDGTPEGGGTVLTSHGGDVVASCQAGGAYLDSWSPAQGFVVGDVRRGPAQTAKVTFDPAAGSGVSGVTMLVSCSAGIPSATTHTWGGDE